MPAEPSPTPAHTTHTSMSTSRHWDNLSTLVLNTCVALPTGMESYDFMRPMPAEPSSTPAHTYTYVLNMSSGTSRHWGTHLLHIVSFDLSMFMSHALPHVADFMTADAGCTHTTHTPIATLSIGGNTLYCTGLTPVEFTPPACSPGRRTTDLPLRNPSQPKTSYLIIDQQHGGRPAVLHQVDCCICQAIQINGPRQLLRGNLISICMWTRTCANSLVSHTAKEATGSHTLILHARRACTATAQGDCCICQGVQINGPGAT